MDLSIDIITRLASLIIKYSASQVDNDTLGFLRFLQAITSPNNLIMYPPVDSNFGQSLKIESVSASKFSAIDLNFIPIFVVPLG